MSLSKQASNKIRANSVNFLISFWENISNFKNILSFSSDSESQETLSLEEKQQQLLLQNQLLENELSYLQKQLNEYELLIYDINQIPSLKDFDNQIKKKKHASSYALKTINWRIKALPARTIFRTFDTWNNSLWINVGEENNQDLEFPVIALNSPVVLGRAIIGIIDHIDKHQSRVRLLTDSQLTPSVRVARGGEQDYLINEQIERLLQQLNNKKTTLTQEDQTQLTFLLEKLRQNLKPFKKSEYLAKGELLGSSFPTKWGHALEIKGTGFNYDFKDEEGESRDLRNGKSIQSSQEQSLPLIKINDVLLTTGMDGVFPAGFQVATITHIELLKEGDYFYNLKAQPIVSHLEELDLVFVLPPIHQESFQH